MRRRLRQRRGPFFVVGVGDQRGDVGFRNDFRGGRWVQKSGRFFRRLGGWVVGLMKS